LVVFTPSGRRGRFPVGTPVLQAARSLGVDIDSVCGGRGICGRCQVLVSEGEFSKHGLTSKLENLSPVGQVEQDYCATQAMADGPAPVLLGQGAGRCGHRRALQQPGAQAGGAQGG